MECKISVHLLTFWGTYCSTAGSERREGSKSGQKGVHAATCYLRALYTRCDCL